MTTKSVTNATLNIVLLSSSTGIKLSLINHNETADTACISLMRTSNGTSHTSNPLLAAHLKMHFPHPDSFPCCTLTSLPVRFSQSLVSLTFHFVLFTNEHANILQNIMTILLKAQISISIVPILSTALFHL